MSNKTDKQSNLKSYLDEEEYNTQNSKLIINKKKMKVKEFKE